MKKKEIIRRLVCLSAAAVTMIGCMPAVGASAASDDLSEHVEIVIGGMALGNSDEEEIWPNEVVSVIEDKFNVTLTIENYDNESLNLDLSGGTTTDIVMIYDDHIENVLKGGHAVNLEDYADIATNIFSENMSFRNELMKTVKSGGEDAQYFVTPRVTYLDTEAKYTTLLSNGYIVRYDLYKEIGCPEITNDDEYIEALLAMKELYPTTEDGLETYAMGVYNDSQLHAYYYKGCLSEGYINLTDGIYVQDATTNELVSDIYDVNEDLDGDTPFWAGVKFYNKLYQAGLLDPDVFITQSEDIQEKYNNGQYLGGTVNWYYGTYNSNQREADSETLKEYITLPSYLGWDNEVSLGGWYGKYFYVSSHSENIERAVMVLDYLQSEEFSRINFSGVEGRWEVAEDGTVALTEDTISMSTDGSRTTEYDETGIGTFNAIVGVDTINVMDDGGLASLWYEDSALESSMTYAEKDFCETLGLSIPSDLLANRVAEGTSIDLGNVLNAIQMALETAPSDITRIDSNIEELTISALPDLVYAESDEDFETAKAVLMEQLKDAGAEESEEWWKNAWNEAKTTVESLLAE